MTFSIKEPSHERPAHNAENREKHKPYKTAIPEVPITTKRMPYVPAKNSKLLDAGTARATVAADAEHPEGTEGWADKHQHQTVLQQHCLFFDPDNDGIIWPLDTWHAFRAWGFIFPLALFGTYIIHAALSYPSSPSWIPDPFFRIHIANVHKNKHGSDSMSYDSEGRFRAQHFEDFFAKYDKDGKGGLTKYEIMSGLRGQAFAFDIFGCTAAALEWTATYILIWPEDGILKKNDVRRVFDGSIFYEKAEEYNGRHSKKA